MIIGYANGSYYRVSKDGLNRFSKECIDGFSMNKKSNAIELHCVSEDMLDYLINNTIDLSNFSFVSLHSPDLIYANDQITERVFKKLETISTKYLIKNFVFHCDKVKDWSIFEKYNYLPISIENMDDRKLFGRSVRDIRSILDLYDFGLTLDLQHCYVNDHTMKLSSELQKRYSDRIVEYHISGYNEKFLHYPLFKTLQDEIIDALQFKDRPIIIESTFDELGEHEKEFEYIVKKILV